MTNVRKIGLGLAIASVVGSAAAYAYGISGMAALEQNPKVRTYLQAREELEQTGDPGMRSYCLHQGRDRKILELISGLEQESEIKRYHFYQPFLALSLPTFILGFGALGILRNP